MGTPTPRASVAHSQSELQVFAGRPAPHPSCLLRQAAGYSQSALPTLARGPAPALRTSFSMRRRSRLRSSQPIRTSEFRREACPSPFPLPSARASFLSAAGHSQSALPTLVRGPALALLASFGTPLLRLAGHLPQVWWCRSPRFLLAAAGSRTTPQGRGDEAGPRFRREDWAPSQLPGRTAQGAASRAILTAEGRYGRLGAERGAGTGRQRCLSSHRRPGVGVSPGGMDEVTAACGGTPVHLPCLWGAGSGAHRGGVPG